MIKTLAGRGVGSGKSYYAVTEIIQHFLLGGTAYVTDAMELHMPKIIQLCKRRHGLVVQESQLIVLDREATASIHMHTRPGTSDCPVLIVLDESQDSLNARDWAEGVKGDKRAMFNWLCQSRHDDNDLIFISQASENIDKQVRRLVTFQLTVRNSCNFPLGVLGTLENVIKMISFGLNSGRYFIVTQFDQDGRTLLSKKWVRHDKAIYECYKSKAMAGRHKRAGGAIGRVKLERVKGSSQTMRIVLIAMLVVACGAGYWLYQRGNPLRPVALAKVPAASTTAGAVAGGRKDARLDADAHGVAYEVLTAPWRTRGPSFIQIPEGMLRVGRMSKFGFVEIVSDDWVVRIKKPDGGLLYIVAEDEVPPVRESSIELTPGPTRRPAAASALERIVSGAHL